MVTDESGITTVAPTVPMFVPDVFSTSTFNEPPLGAVPNGVELTVTDASAHGNGASQIADSKQVICASVSLAITDGSQKL